MEDYLLALDLGTSSIGYVAFGLNRKMEPDSIKDLGMRIFSDGRNSKTKEPLAVARRSARGMRRNRDRGQNRVRRLVAELIEFGLLPQNDSERTKIFQKLNPYECRSKCAVSQVNAYELGRALFHLGRRRGFKSNRLSGDSEESDFKQKIAKLKVELGNLTLGQYLFTKVEKNNAIRLKNRELHLQNKMDKQKSNPTNQKAVRFKDDVEFYADRAMYEQEFDLIREVQGDAFLTDPQWFAIRETVFWQYPLKPVPKGRCRFFVDQFRANISLPMAHEFRILQEINNLRYESDGLEFKLDTRQKNFLYQLLANVKTVRFKSLVKKKDENKSPYFPSDARFNLDVGSRNGMLIGNDVLVDLRKPENLGILADTLGGQELNDIVDFLIEPTASDENGSWVLDDAAIRRWLKKRLANIEETQIENLINLKFKRGTVAVSRKFIEKINPIMLSTGKEYWEAVQDVEEATGISFHHSNFETGEVLNRLPYYGEIMPESVWGERPETDKAKQPDERDDDAYNFGKIANPTVHVALNQLRKVVNNIIEKLGIPPARIHIELTRDLKNSKEARQKWDKLSATNKKRNDTIREILSTEFKIDRPGREDIQKYKLWEELGAQGARQSVFSGKTIAASHLFDKSVEIEHIVPFSECYDDGMNNKTLAFSSENRDKADRTPYAAFGNTEKYDEIMRRALKCFGQTSKYERFKEGAFEKFYGGERGNMIARQLNDTKYLSRKAAQYLACLCTSNNVVTVNGQMTAVLRDVWQLNHFKDRSTGHYRDDHRHHIVDAFVVGLTSRSLIKKLNTKTSTSKHHKATLYHFLKDRAPEIPELKRELLHRLEDVVASYKPDHTMHGSMYNETAYGITTEAGVQWCITRKAVSVLSYDEVFRLQSADHRADLITFLTNGLLVDNKKDLKEILRTDKNFTEKKDEFSKVTGIKKVRLKIPNDSVKPIHSAPFKGYSINSYAYCDVWMVPTRRKSTDTEWQYKYQGVFVPYAEVRSFVNVPKRPVGTDGRVHPAAKRLMRLFKNDNIQLKSNSDSSTTVLRVVGFSASQNKLDVAANLSAQNTGHNYVSTNVLFSQNTISKMRS